MRDTVLVTSGRKGTFLLLTSLEKHPQIFCHDQLFGAPPETRHPFVRGLTGYAAGAKVFNREAVDIGSHVSVIFPAAPTMQEPQKEESFWTYVASRPEIQLLHLRRRNLFKGYVSALIAKETGLWSNRYPSQGGEPRPLINPEAAEKFLYWDRKNSIDCETRFADHVNLTVFYEDLVKQLPHYLKLVQTFLGVEPMPLMPRTKKQASRTLAESIVNYDELKERWKGTEFEQYLD